MAIAFRSSTTATSTGLLTIGCAVPAGIQAGDLLLFSIGWDNAASAISSWPAGFATVPNTFQQQGAPDGNTHICGYKIASGSESGTLTATFTSANGAGAAASLRAYSGVDPANPFDATAVVTINTTANATPITVTAPTISTVKANAMLVYFGSSDDSGVTATSFPAPTGFANADNPFRNFTNLCVADKIQASPGASGSVSAVLTLPSGTAGWAAFLLALRPFVYAPPPNVDAPAEQVRRRRRWGGKSMGVDIREWW